jgi:hypothetical protein
MRTNLCTLFLLVALPCSFVNADTLNYTVTAAGAGEDLYQFTLSNTGSTGGTLSDLFVALPIDINDVLTSTIGTPAGWGDSNGGLLFFGPDGGPSTSFIEWTADFSGTHDVHIGTALTGFSFRTLQPINGPITFGLNGSTTLDTAVPGSSVPEPPTLLVLLFAIALLGFGRMLRPQAKGAK